MKKIFITALCLTFSLPVFAKDITKTAEYKNAYECAMDGLTNDPNLMIISHCIGNSHDPSKIELAGFKKAKADFKKKHKVKR